MLKKKFPIVLLILAIVGGGIYYVSARQPDEIILTGIVTTDDVIVSPQMQGRLSRLTVEQGDTVRTNQLLAIIQPEEQKANADFYASSQQQYAAQVKQAEADLENARLTFQRDEPLYKTQAVSEQDYDQARFAYQAAQQRVESLKRQAEAATAEHEKAMVQLGYTQILSPIDAIVDTRVARQGEVLNPGQPIVTLINLDDLWVRADVEETYIDQIKVGQVMKVKLPSGRILDGAVFYRGADADYATQRDVSRTKRDIKTFEIRLRCDNKDRALAVGMTAYVTLPLNHG